MQGKTLWVAAAVPFLVIGYIAGTAFNLHENAITRCDMMTSTCNHDQWQAWRAEERANTIAVWQNALDVARLSVKSNAISTESTMALKHANADAQAYENEKLEASIHDKTLLRGWHPQLNGSFDGDAKATSCTAVTVLRDSYQCIR